MVAWRLPSSTQLSVLGNPAPPLQGDNLQYLNEAQI